jgi:TRAP-type C4-dicarboxylate transport system permease small subunit
LADGQHVALEFIQRLFPATVQRALRVFVQLAILAFLLFCIVAGWALLELFENYSFITLPFSKQWLFLAVPTSCVLMMPFVLETILLEFRKDKIAVKAVESKMPSSV